MNENVTPNKCDRVLNCIRSLLVTVHLISSHEMRLPIILPLPTYSSEGITT
jgi:hypothetical protein